MKSSCMIVHQRWKLLHLRLCRLSITSKAGRSCWDYSPENLLSNFWAYLRAQTQEAYQWHPLHNSRDEELTFCKRPWTAPWDEVFPRNFLKVDNFLYLSSEFIKSIDPDRRGFQASKQIVSAVQNGVDTVALLKYSPCTKFGNCELVSRC